MRDTIHCLTDGEPDAGRASPPPSHAMVREVQKYVPGYTLKNGPVFDGTARHACSWRSQGLGDYLPKYAGNLDIMTAAALRTARDVRRSCASIA